MCACSRSTIVPLLANSLPIDGDEREPYTRAQLVRFDARFRERIERAIRLGLENPDAVT
jgi:hypothetical protein